MLIFIKLVILFGFINITNFQYLFSYHFIIIIIITFISFQNLFSYHFIIIIIIGFISYQYLFSYHFKLIIIISRNYYFRFRDHQLHNMPCFLYFHRFHLHIIILNNSFVFFINIFNFFIK